MLMFFYGLVQNCGSSSVSAMEMLQTYIELWFTVKLSMFW